MSMGEFLHKVRHSIPAKAAHKRGVMNGYERDYAAVLRGRQACGEIAGFWFEAVQLNLAPLLRCTYTPDFMVQTNEGIIEFHEVKGHWEEDARVKVKCAADKFPFRFVAVTKPTKKTPWQYELFEAVAKEGGQ